MKIWRRLVFLLLALSPAAPAAEPVRSLAEAAKIVAAKMPAGGLVTAERVGARDEFSGAGQLEPAGVPPEQLIFEIGSLTKVFTSLLLAQAVTEGKVSLETTVASLLGPEAHFEDPRVGAITLRQLSTHTSGLPRLPPNLSAGANPADPYAHYDRARLLAGVTSTRLEGEGPFPVSYSNFGAGLLGDLLARLYGKPWEELVRAKIALPLGMTDTTVTLDPAQQARLAPPWTGTEASHAWNLGALVGAGGLRSTARDLLQLGAAILAPEKSPFPEALALQLQPQTKDGQIGLGLFRRGTGAELTLYHEGGTGGYGSVLEIRPAEGRIRVVLSDNSDWPPIKVIAATAADLPAPKEAAEAPAAEALRPYAGVYQVDSMMRFTLLLRGAELWARLSGQPFYRIIPEEKPDRFFYRIVPAEIEFRREGEKVAGLTLFQNGRTILAAKTGPAPEFLFPPAAELEEYAGTYAFGPGLTFSLKVMDGTLFAQLTGQGPAPVFATRKDYFEYDVVTAALEFERDEKGAVIAVKLHQNGLIQRAPRAK